MILMFGICRRVNNVPAGGVTGDIERRVTPGGLVFGLCRRVNNAPAGTSTGDIVRNVAPGGGMIFTITRRVNNPPEGVAVGDTYRLARLAIERFDTLRRMNAAVAVHIDTLMIKSHVPVTVRVDTRRRVKGPVTAIADTRRLVRGKIKKPTVSDTTIIQPEIANILTFPAESILDVIMFEFAGVDWSAFAGMFNEWEASAQMMSVYSYIGPPVYDEHEDGDINGLPNSANWTLDSTFQLDTSMIIAGIRALAVPFKNFIASGESIASLVNRYRVVTSTVFADVGWKVQATGEARIGFDTRRWVKSSVTVRIDTKRRLVNTIAACDTLRRVVTRGREHQRLIPIKTANDSSFMVTLEPTNAWQLFDGTTMTYWNTLWGSKAFYLYWRTDSRTIIKEMQFAPGDTIEHMPRNIQLFGAKKNAVFQAGGSEFQRIANISIGGRQTELIPVDNTTAYQTYRMFIYDMMVDYAAFSEIYVGGIILTSIDTKRYIVPQDATTSVEIMRRIGMGDEIGAGLVRRAGAAEAYPFATSRLVSNGSEGVIKCAAHRILSGDFLSIFR